MGSKWKECELGDFIELKRGYDLPKSTRNEGSIPIISSSGFTDFHDKPMVKGPGVVTGRYGTIGEVFYSEEDFWPLNTTLYVVDFKGNDPLFVYYLLQTISYADYTDKAAVPGVNRNHLHKAKVKVPIYLDIQQKVAAQLYQLEKRVTLGKQINQTLEQMSQTLFKSWFVDFDPVIDNALDAGNSIPEALQSRAELRQKVRNSADFKPLPADIRALFPAEFEETELTYAPKGWVTNRLENILELAYGKALKKTERTNGDYPVYGSGGVDGTHNEYLVKGPGIIVGRKGTVGSLHWENKDFYPIDTVFFVKPKEYFPLVYCYQLLKTLGLENMNTDAAVPGLNRNNAYRLEVVTPTQPIIAKFTNIIQAIQFKIDSNHNETENLTALRDTLLPKLISGELSLEDLPDLVDQTEPA
ncbi:restriction endonuclease subunit S [Citrobacter portucalensis]|uniref:restriction endonuclease subunit S n=1 Tax=Citrobacter portucalensis TaxID=1639133 RepID=UPI003CF77677